LGAIAALDVFDGRVRWVSTYSTQPRQRNERSNHLKTGLTPCLFYQGTVVVAPADTDRILAYESESGQLLWDRHISDTVRHLLGVGNGNLIVSGDQLRAIGLQDGTTKWKHAVSDPAGFGYGRGLLVEDQIYWPTREEIVVIDQRNGRMTRQPINLRAKGGTGGNLAIAGDLLLIAEANRLVAYTEFGRLKKRSRIDISAQPDDRRPVSRLGQSGDKLGSLD
jgi:outer membrane protein assembly factor BamB